MDMHGVTNDTSTSSGRESCADGTGDTCASLNKMEQISPPTPRWRHGCISKYMHGTCEDQYCSSLHDLNSEETEVLLKHKEQALHVVFSDTSSHSTTHSTHGTQRNSASDPSEQQSNAESGTQDLRQQLSKKFAGMDDGTILRKLPLTRSGHPSSMGSVMHAHGTCRPCRFILLGQHCRHGFRCHFCHLEHSQLSGLLELNPSHDGLPPTAATRPSKAKRTRYKEMVKELEADIFLDPWGWSIDAVQIPPEIDCKPDVKQKLMIRLATTADKARSSCVQQNNAGGNAGGNNASSSNSARNCSAGMPLGPSQLPSPPSDSRQSSPRIVSL